jgi:predicted hydrolase (HD superfamily)
MISRSEAFRLLKSIVKEEHKLTHAAQVAEMMASLAGQFHLPTEKWYLTGLLHDIDIPSIGNDWSRHGIKAQKILAGLLPPQALKAIETHDRNTGVKSESRISQSLRLADVVDNLSRSVPMEELKSAMQTMDFDALKEKLPKDLYNLQIIADFARKWPEIRIE